MNSDGRLEFEEINGYIVIRPIGEFSINNSFRLTPFFLDRFMEGYERFIIDTAELEYFDSTIIGAMISIWFKLRRRSPRGEIVIIPNKMTESILDTSGLKSRALLAVDIKEAMFLFEGYPLEELVKRNDTAQTHLRRANLLKYKSQYQAALSVYEILIRKSVLGVTLDARLWFNHGFCHLRLNEMDAARESFDIALALAPDSKGIRRRVELALASD